MVTRCFGVAGRSRAQRNDVGSCDTGTTAETRNGEKSDVVLEIIAAMPARLMQFSNSLTDNLRQPRA